MVKLTRVPAFNRSLKSDPQPQEAASRRSGQSNVGFSVQGEAMGRSAALLNLLIGLVPISLGVLVVVAVSMGTSGSLLAAAFLAAASFVSMLLAKLPAYRAGRWLTFGPSSLPQRSRQLWWASWALLAVAAFFAIVGPVAT